jgi:hypothetical protein
MLLGISFKYTSTFTTYLMLLTVDPDVAAGGGPFYDPTLAELTELSATGYARQAVTWVAAAEGSYSTEAVNSADINFGPFTGSTGSGADPIIFAALTTAASGTTGDVLWTWPTGGPLSVAQNVPILCPAGSLVADLASYQG